MPSLAVFDFDRTIVSADSDATIIGRLREKQPPPEWEAGSHDWTPYMSDVFAHAYSAGLHSEDILSAIASMPGAAGARPLLAALAAAGWDVIVLSDANSVFISHWLETHGLEKYITSVITNRAFWQDGRLLIEPCMKQSACGRCPSNLCKSLALAQWCATRPYERVIYVGDGRNDYCPATNLADNAIVFPRNGYPMHQLIAKTMASAAPEIKAKVVPWEDHYRILEEIFPTVTPE